MTGYRRVWVVYRKELVDTLRDKRTLIAMVLVPILLYPILMVVMFEALRTETGRRQAEKYSVCVPTESHRRWLRAVLEREDAEREADRAAAESAGEPDALTESGLVAYLRSDQIEIDVLGPRASLWNPVIEQKYHAGILVEPPPNPDQIADGVNRVVQIIYSETDPRSEFVFMQLRRAMSRESDRIVRARLSDLPGGDALLTPLLTNELSTSSPQQQFAKILALVVPFLLVIITVTGAMYPAIDLTAGERERGTLETLAVSPVPVGQIVAGKFGVIVTIAMISTMLNLGSMSAMVHFSKLDRLAGSLSPSRRAEAISAAEMIEQSRPADKIGYSQRDYLERRQQMEQQAQQKMSMLTTAAPIVLLAMVPFTVLFGAIMLAACSFARTFKEAQNYMLPVMMTAMVPALVVSYMPTIKLEGVILVIPVANIVVLIRELFLGHYDIAAIGICLLSTCFYAVTAVCVAARLYGNEAVLFSDVGSYRTLLRRRFFKPQTYPAAALSLLTVAMIFPVNFYWQSHLLGLDTGGARYAWVVAGAQLLLFALPVLAVSWYLKLDMRRTFSWFAPDGLSLVGAVLLASSVVPVSHLLQQIQFSLFPPSPSSEALFKQQAALVAKCSPAALVIVFAVIPGICEELAFRGFLLAGIRRRLRSYQVVLVVGLVFGLFHVYVEKIPVAGLVGMLLAFVCLRCGSILLPMIIHIANNALALGAGQVEAIRRFFGILETQAVSGSVDFNTRTALFMGVFVIGLALVATRRIDRSHRAQVQR